MENTWDLSKIYKNDEELENDINNVKESANKIKSYKENAKENLLQILEEVENIQRLSSKLYSYSAMKRDEDSRVSESQRRLLQIETLSVEIENITSFIKPFILSLEEEELDKILKDEDFEKYHLMLERLSRLKEHTLSDNEENIIANLSPAMTTPQSSYYMLENADMTYGKVEGTDEELTNSNFIDFLLRDDREVRKNAFNLMYERQSEFENTIGTMMYSNVRDLTQIAKIRNYESARQMELYRDDVPVKLYDDLIDMVHEYLPYYQKFYEIRNKRLGLDEAHMYDVYVPISESSKEYSVEEAKEIIIEAMAPLGEEYQNLLRKAFEDRWIDMFPRDGKASGAYSWGNYDSDPYILMNYTGSLDSVFTLAHELGHSIHSYYSRKNNNFLESNYTIFVAEVASTFNENLLIEYLMERSETTEEKIHILNHHLDSFKGTVFRQTMFAEFEKITHERIESGEALTAEDFHKIYMDLNKKYFGDAVISDDNIQYEWMRIPHFYRNFYVYKYATGFSCATILSQNVLNGGEEELEKYYNFLKDGCNHYPLEQLKNAGADLLDPESLRKSFEVFKEKVLELEELID